MFAYSTLLRPLLFTLDPEWVHEGTISLSERLSRSSLALRMVRRFYDVQHKGLELSLGGLQFKNPIGLAAGFDKNGRIHPLMAALGFGHVDIGSVSLRPWRGNPSPTLLRLPKDGALINRPGLKSEGSEKVYERLKKSAFTVPIGMNLVKTADPAIVGEAAFLDYLENVKKFYPLADYITLNLSCPNTSEGRTFENPEILDTFLTRLSPVRRELIERHGKKVILLKVAPDLTDETLLEIMSIAARYEMDGFVVANTTSRREGLKTPGKVLERFGFGGLSGRPLKKYVQEMVSKVQRHGGGRFHIMACGGVGCEPHVSPANEVWEYLKLGATLVQLHTGLIYFGPSIVKSINEGLVRILEAHKYSSLAEFMRRRS
ncbi:MAG: quinone-dependent dihydroorotate dehydrogenase [Acidobacteria bacterium]|nr:quinone-dependent dihydroorotate dehydrogenase [Acidobacteriota bacterium]